MTQSQIQSPQKSSVDNFSDRVNLEEGDETFESNECEKVMKYAAKHRENLETKKNLEKITQQIHSALWSFPTQDTIYEGICGCNVPVQYNYNCRIATFNQSLFENLSEKFLELHEFNANSVFMSLYQQTYSELQLSRYIHAKIATLRSIVIFFSYLLQFFFLLRIIIIIKKKFFLMHFHFINKFKNRKIYQRNSI